MNNLIYVTLILGIFDTAACLAAKLWAIGKGNIFLYLCVICFALAGLFFAHSVKFNALAIVNVAWIAVSVVFITIIDYFYFKQNLNLTQLIGMVLVVIGFAMINLKSA